LPSVEGEHINRLNLHVQCLLVKRGYVLAGIIHHLDEGDPELVYVKILNNPSFNG